MRDRPRRGRPPLDVTDSPVNVTLKLAGDQCDLLCEQERRERISVAELSFAKTTAALPGFDVRLHRRNRTFRRLDAKRLHRSGAELPIDNPSRH